MEKYKIIGICGSLREQSYNKSILEYVAANSPDSMEIQIESISNFPLFNEDIEKEGFPSMVQDIREKIRNADGLIIITPEYNSSVPGVLKNAVDWISRKDENCYLFSKKPIIIAGATTGLTGTSRLQKELRAVLHNINTFPMNKPELFISQADKKYLMAS